MQTLEVALKALHLFGSEKLHEFDIVGFKIK